MSQNKIEKLLEMIKDKESKVYAFIDSQNLNLGIESLGWKLDFKRFRVYLKEKYKVSTAYVFIGYVATNQNLYSFLQKAGYVLIFKPTLPDKDGEVKGNVDADLVLQAMIDFSKYDQAIIVSSDGDFYSLVKHLYGQRKLSFVMSPYVKTCSVLLKKAAREKIVFMDNLRHKLEFNQRINEKAPLEDKT
ncbi:MAG: hypothetical protein A2117_02045 [Candidatus Wildermuthbacteria bacterium GWA2_46_15]|uniref:NYN domain-containing protein n=1 Tax=Candidatus Wildermuthbacteria bacterium GWA2_46_15 TaxID=1802443 RepID=A0A1G2QPW2_9BACT|nr:MAG: hypothetical protein A2117_02045 [Candidatus Wildermuthbacteria bacterium GWA2_46_15]